MLGLGKIAKKVFGTPNDRRIREVQAIVENINSLEKDFSLLSDSEITSKTKEFKQRYGENITHETYVENLYLNVLNRELDQGGYDYWVGNLNNGIEQRHEVLLGFSESAENRMLYADMTGYYKHGITVN